MTANDTVAMALAERLNQLEKQLLNVWEALSTREKSNPFLLAKFDSLRGRMLDLKEWAKFETEGPTKL